jgi:hypothetical protein
MRYCVKIADLHSISKILKKLSAIVPVCLAFMLLVACDQTADGYGFEVQDVSVSRGYQSLDIHLKQVLTLSDEAQDALQHGVTLTIRLDLELRNDSNMIVVRRLERRFQIHFLPLSERYQLIDEKTDELKSFSRLRHVFAAIGDLYVRLPTGPLPSGNYELRTRVQLEEGLLPAPMQLPAMFSSQWRHDSEWSVWPFKVSV